MTNNSGDGGKRRHNHPWVLGTLIYEGVGLKKRGKMGLFHFCLSIHYPNNRFENISVFLFATFQLCSQKIPVLK